MRGPEAPLLGLAFGLGVADLEQELGLDGVLREIGADFHDNLLPGEPGEPLLEGGESPERLGLLLPQVPGWPFGKGLAFGRQLSRSFP